MTNPEDTLLHFKRIRKTLAEDIRILRKSLIAYMKVFDDYIVINHYLDLINDRRQKGKKYPIHLKFVEKNTYYAFSSLPNVESRKRESIIELANLAAYLRYCC